MATHVPPKKNDVNGYVTYVSLVSQADTKIFQVNPTLAAGDVKVAVDDAAPANLGTLPAVDADFTKRVKVTLSQAETNGDNITIIFSDAAGSEWCDLTINIPTSAQTLDAIDTNVDDIETDTNEIQGKLPTNKFMGSSDGADDDGTLNTIATDAARLTAVRAAVLTDWINGGRLDLLLDAIKVVTDNQAAASTTLITGTVSHDNEAATTTVIYSDDVTEATADHYNGRLFVPTSGALVGQYTDITDYELENGEGKFTVTALTEAPADNTTFVII